MVKVSRNSTTTLALQAGSGPESSSLWEVHNQLEQVIASDKAPHHWEVTSIDQGETVTISVPEYALVMPHTLYWRSDPNLPFRRVSFTIV